MPDQLIFVVFAFIAILAVGAPVAYFRTRNRKDLQTFKAEAADQFNAWLSSSAAHQLGLHPDSCEIAQRSESIGQYEGGTVYSYTLTIFMRSSNGDYIMFKSTPRGPYVKLVEPAVAKAVLKESYVPRSAG